MSTSRLSTPTTPTTPTTKSTTAPPTPTSYVWSDFQDFPNGKVTKAVFESKIGSGPIPDNAFQDLTIRDEGGPHGKFIRTFLKAGAILNSSPGPNGTAMSIDLRKPLERGCISYDLRFDADFEWSMGGKLPGLIGLSPTTRMAPVGGRPQQDGFSARTVWEGPEMYDLAGPRSAVQSYVYHPGQIGQYGDAEHWSRGFAKGAWQHVKQCVVLNTPGQKDGSLRVWLNGDLVVNRPSYVFRLTSRVHIDRIAWDIFRGGNTLSYASTRDGYVDIDNFAVTST